MCGIAAVALESTYLVTSYMPPEENQFLHASIPVRGLVAVCIAGILLTEGQNRRMSKEGFWELTGLMVADTLAFTANGLWLGRWDGIVSGATAAIWGV